MPTEARIERQIPKDWRCRHLLGIEPESSLRASSMLLIAEPFIQPLFLFFFVKDEQIEPRVSICMLIT